MPDYSAINFWKQYAKELSVLGEHEGTQALYDTSTGWTKRNGEVVKRVMEEFFNLDTRSWLQFDCCGYENFDNKHDWQIRIAYEHENDDWKVEICKLAHVWADLRVLVGYWDFKKEQTEPSTKSLRTSLSNWLRAMEDRGKRISRLETAKWLFIFGPRVRSFGDEYPYVAYDIDPKPDDRLSLRELKLDEPLNPYHWK